MGKKSSRTKKNRLNVNNVDSTLLKLNEMLSNISSNYHNLQYYKRGGTRDIFVCDYGKFGEKKVIKVDLLDADFNAKRVLDRGYDTENEVAMLSTIESTGVIVPDYVHEQKSKDFGINGLVSIEPYYRDSATLQEIIDSHGALFSEMGIYDAIGKMIIDLKYIINGEDVASGIGIIHRDIKPSNILIRSRGDRNSAKIIDWANSCEVGHVSNHYQPTRGGVETAHPFLIKEFTNSNSDYDIRSEIYSVMSTIVYALRGKPIFKFDFKRKKVYDSDRKRSILDSDGNVDFEKHDDHVEIVSQSLERFGLFHIVMNRALSLRCNYYQNNFDQFVSDLLYCPEFNLPRLLYQRNMEDNLSRDMKLVKEETERLSKTNIININPY